MKLEGLTPTQAKLAAAVAKHGWDNRKVAAELGIEPRTASRQLYKLKKKAARQGDAPDEGYKMLQPPGFSLKGVSTYGKIDPDTGEFAPTAQWYKSDRDKEQQFEAMRDAVEEMARECYGKVTRVKAPSRTSSIDDMMVVYGIGDHHHGMYSWARETGADYDCEISQCILEGAFREMVDVAKPTAEATIISVGDYFHADDAKARTPASGHALDVDGRHSRVIQTGCRMLINAIRMALRKHQKVRFIPVPGNHDPLSTMWLAILLDSTFADEPRVTIDVCPRQYRYLQWGRCLIGTTHGDKCKPAALGEVMAADVPELWGATEHRHWYTGHMHHRWLQELRGCMVECLPVMPPPDAWHAGQGYRSKRGVQLDMWHKEHGRLTSWNFPIGYIENGNA